jgi:hypothetical protein
MLPSLSSHAPAQLDSNQHSVLVNVYQFLIRLTELAQLEPTLPTLTS